MLTKTPFSSKQRLCALLYFATSLVKTAVMRAARLSRGKSEHSCAYLSQTIRSHLLCNRYAVSFFCRKKSTPKLTAVNRYVGRSAERKRQKQRLRRVNADPQRFSAEHRQRQNLILNFAERRRFAVKSATHLSLNLLRINKHKDTRRPPADILP